MRHGLGDRYPKFQLRFEFHTLGPFAWHCSRGLSTWTECWLEHPQEICKYIHLAIAIVSRSVSRNTSEIFRTTENLGLQWITIYFFPRVSLLQVCLNIRIHQVDFIIILRNCNSPAPGVSLIPGNFSWFLLGPNKNAFLEEHWNSSLPW